MQYLRDNAGVLEASNNGTDWETVVLGEGGGGIPTEIDNPVTLGDLILRDNAGVFEVSYDEGENWMTPLWNTPQIDLQSHTLMPPLLYQNTAPSEVGVYIWCDTTDGKYYLFFRDSYGTKKIELT